MTFLIADTFTDSLARMTGDEQKAVKTTAFDLQMNPSAPGLSFHKLDRAKDKRFWSVRVSADIRLIVHRTDRSLLLCYVDHHDRSYAWAERRKLETHPTTGAAQIIELREAVREIVVPTYVHAEPTPKPAPRPLAATSDEQLLGFGVPSDWLNDVRDADEDRLLALAQHLPAEAAEAVLELATGGTPHPVSPAPLETTSDPFTHPDAQRRFRVVTSVEELERALDAPWDKWAAGLSPRVLDERVDVRPGEANVATMHLAKGLEFRAVAVLACDDDVLPLQSRIEGVGDEGDLQETYDTERQLLYVACTRARDRLFVSGVEPGSEFLADLAVS